MPAFFALRTKGVEHFWGDRRKKLWVLHPVNAELRTGDYREIHTTRCGGNLESGAHRLSGALAREKKTNLPVNNFIIVLLPRSTP